MVNTIKRLDANDCFDYFVNNFDAVYQNESTYRNNATLDPEITNNILYLNLRDHYVAHILDVPDYQNFDVNFSRDSDTSDDFIVATFSDLDNNMTVSVEINRGDEPEITEELFKTGLQTLKSTYASEVYEMKPENHQ